MEAASVAAPPPPPPATACLSKGKKIESTSFSPGTDKRFWSDLRSRVDTLLESKPELDYQSSDKRSEEVGKANRLSDDTKLFLRGFDSVAHTLSQLSSNIDFALQGAKDLAKPPTMTDILQASMKSIETKESLKEDESKDKEEGSDKGKKRKLSEEHPSECSEADSAKDEECSPKMLKKAKNLAVSMATKASFLAKELKSIKSDLCFMQERCLILEEENEMLRHGYNKGIQPEEDDLVRLQLEALLAEKSRLANENANLTRENQGLRQLVEYHQATSQDLSATYEEVINGICLDFSSPPSSKLDGAHEKNEGNFGSNLPSTEDEEHQFKGFPKCSYSP